MSKVLVICTSPRKNGNSEILADEFIRGAKEAGHETEKVCLYDKTINFCKGCLACQKTKTGHCVMSDDADSIIQKMRKADVLAFATPIYFYEMSGQMKTLLDRTNPLFAVDSSFKDIYLIAAAADTADTSADRAAEGLKGWIECFEQTRLAGVVGGFGADDKGTIHNFPKSLQAAYEMGKQI